MALADSGALWKLAFCAGHAGISRRDITAHIANESAEIRIVAFIITSCLELPRSSSAGRLPSIQATNFWNNSPHPIPSNPQPSPRAGVLLFVKVGFHSPTLHNHGRPFIMRGPPPAFSSAGAGKGPHVLRVGMRRPPRKELR